MPIKSVKSDGPPPQKVNIAWNGSDRFMKAVMRELFTEWNITEANWLGNRLMPVNSAIIYDRYDQILVNEINGKIHYRKISKEERDAAFQKASAGRISDPLQDAKN